MDTLLLVGDGPVADAIVAMTDVLGWRTTAVTTLDDALAALPDARAVVVTSHHDHVDGPALAAALAADPSRLLYIGAMGSRRTQDRRRAHLDGVGLDAQAQSRIHGPAGLDIGADAPQEIAVAILAELVNVVRGGNAGSISDRDGPIHPQLGPGEAFCPTG